MTHIETEDGTKLSIKETLDVYFDLLKDMSFHFNVSDVVLSQVSHEFQKELLSHALEMNSFIERVEDVGDASFQDKEYLQLNAKDQAYRSCLREMKIHIEKSLKLSLL